jgi:hypothetical protein
MRSLLSKKAGGLSCEARGVALIPFTVAEKARTVGLNRPGFGYLRIVFSFIKDNLREVHYVSYLFFLGRPRY